jgi:predicted RNA-binding protein YlqC (UPF0109 family)
MAESRNVVELVEFIAKAIVTQPEDIVVREAEDRTIELETAPDDRGRVIGRQGRSAKAMRALLASSRSGVNHRLEILD